MQKMGLIIMQEMKEVTHLQIKNQKGYLSRLSVQGRELSKEKKEITDKNKTHN